MHDAPAVHAGLMPGVVDDRQVDRDAEADRPPGPASPGEAASLIDTDLIVDLQSCVGRDRRPIGWAWLLGPVTTSVGVLLKPAAFAAGLGADLVGQRRGLRGRSSIGRSSARGSAWPARRGSCRSRSWCPRRPARGRRARCSSSRASACRRPAPPPGWARTSSRWPCPEAVSSAL